MRRVLNSPGIRASVLLALPLFVTGCSTFSVSNSLYDCPHPWHEVKKAEQYVTLVLDLPQQELTAQPTAENPRGGPCRRVPIAGYFTAACVNVQNGIIWRDDSLPSLNRLGAYRHELCHLYEERVLGLADHGHLGWLVNAGG